MGDSAEQGFAQRIRSIDDDEFKPFASELIQLPELRVKLSERRPTWEAMAERLRKYRNASPPRPVLQFVNNLAATSQAGPIALRAGVFAFYLQLEPADDLTDGKLRWQTLANFAMGLKPADGEEASTAVAQNYAKLAIGNTVTSGSLSVTIPCLLFVKAIASIVNTDALLLLLFRTGYFGAVMSMAPVWFEEEDANDQCVAALIATLKTGLTSGLLGEMVEECRLSERKDWEVTLFKVIDGIIAAPSFVETSGSFLGSSRAEQTALVLRDEAGAALQDITALIPMRDRRTPHALNAWQKVLSLLDTCSTLLQRERNVGLRPPFRTLLPHLISCLLTAKSLPKISKLSNVLQDQDLRSEDFPYLKSAIIPVMTVLVKDSHESQEIARESGGLAAVLECCVIDANNPFMKERAVVCLRYLLENNQQNQQFVAKLEAKQVADPDALEKAGYEAEIIDGKISVKRK